MCFRRHIILWPASMDAKYSCVVNNSLLNQSLHCYLAYSFAAIRFPSMLLTIWNNLWDRLLCGEVDHCISDLGIFFFCKNRLRGLSINP